ncbi:hypothetical protein C8R45DRAFT_1145705 [Mycena sanguinolenta]|nr:hypothetical protein C8R45DRAFT_1145705 [Mycena sanguinolenta]
MSSSSTSPTTSSLFMKRRRAYVACGNCRRRKVKCITPSEVDYKPCTRCAQKGLKCEYFPGLGDEPSLEPITPPASNQPSSHYLDKSCSPPPITPPSAGISEYLKSSSRSTHRGTVPPSNSARYPSHSTPVPAAPPTAEPNSLWTQQPTPQYFATNPYSAAMQQHPSGAAAPQYYPNATPYMGNPNIHSGSTYSQQQYPQHAPQASGMVSSWL